MKNTKTMKSGKIEYVDMRRVDDLLAIIRDKRYMQVFGKTMDDMTIDEWERSVKIHDEMSLAVNIKDFPGLVTEIQEMGPFSDKSLSKLEHLFKGNSLPLLTVIGCWKVLMSAKVWREIEIDKLEEKAQAFGIADKEQMLAALELAEINPPISLDGSKETWVRFPSYKIGNEFLEAEISVSSDPEGIPLYRLFIYDVATMLVEHDYSSSSFVNLLLTIKVHLMLDPDLTMKDILIGHTVLKNKVEGAPNV